MRNYLFFLLSMLSSVQFMGSGFQISLQGQPQIGMAHAGTAVPLNAAALFYNPAGMGFLQGKKLMLGINPIYGRAEYLQLSTAQRGSNEFGISLPFSAYYTQRLGPAGAPSRFTVGIGVYTPFGSNISYPEDWMGKFLVQNATLTTVFVQPTISYNVNNRISIGFGVVGGYGNFKIQRAIPLYGEEGYGTAKLQAAGTGFGFTSGVFIEPWANKLTVGVSYKSSARVKLEGGDAEFTVPATADILFPDTKFNLNVGLPDALTIAVAYYFDTKNGETLPDKSNASLITFEVERVGWSIFKDLNFEYAETVAGASNLKLIRNYQNTYRFSIGGQYVAAKRLTLRAGAYYDLNAAPDCCATPETPDTKRIVGTVGLTANLTSRLNLDLSFLYGRGLERKTVNTQNNFETTMKGYVITPGIGVQYSF